MIALIVSLQVRPDKIEEFLAAIEENAARSFADEPGCLQFDVTRDLKDPQHFWFYEIYTDAAAFEAHKTAPHFADWRRAADVCLVPGSQVNTFADLLFHHA